MEPERLFKRKIYDRLLQWKESSNGQTALLIEGARRIGKSTIVKAFAQNEYESFIFIDFTKCSQEVKNLFNDVSDLNYIFLRLQLAYGVQLVERKSLIVFDEVPFQPLARQAIKSFVEDHRYDYIETGSLISIRKNTDKILIPSEEERICMYPMDYEEFRWAMGDKETIPLLKEMLEKKRPLGDDVNRKMLRDYRLYMLVGGMPQAVSKYIETRDLMKVDKVKRGILRIYEQDFHKMDKTDRAKAIFKAIPSELYKNATRYQITTVLGRINSDSIRGLIEMIEDSKTVNIAYHSNDPNVGMELTSDKSSYKMYVCDTGLFVTLAFWDKKFTENIIYKKLLNDKLEANLGYVYENAVAQALASSGNKLFYYTWLDENNHPFEIDFLLSRGSKLWPLEVKSSGYNKHKSLDEFCRKYSGRISSRYLVYTKDLRKDCETTMIPIYMAGLL